MPEYNIQDARGLETSRNRVDAGLEGWAARCKNVVVRNEGVYEPRWPLAAVGTTATVNRFVWDPINRQMLRLGADEADVLDKLSGSTWTSLDATRGYVDGAADRGHFWLLSEEGLRRVNPGNTATEIGFVPEGLDIALVQLSGSSGWMPNDSQVGYRVVFGIKGSANSNEFFLGAPSGRLVVVNSAGDTRDVDLRLTVPSELTTDHFVQIYRTRPSAGSSIDPGDEHFLIWEHQLTSTDISTNGYYDFTDRVPENNGGPSLYSNASQQTDTQQNSPCEAAQGSNGEGSLVAYAGVLWAANYQPRSSLTVHMLSTLTDTGVNARSITGDTNSNDTIDNVSASDFDGLAVGQRIEGTDIPAGTNITALDSGAGTITISSTATGSSAGVTLTCGDRLTLAGTEYVAWTSEDIANDKFLVSTDANVARSIRETSESFVRVVNRSSSNSEVYARYLSGPNELPGRILIVARTDRASTYTIQAHAHANGWWPVLGSAQTILSLREPSLIAHSKPGEPHAWPALNTIRLPEQAEALELTPLRAALLVWTDKGLYRISGVYGNFVLELVDRSVIPVTSSTNPGYGSVVDNNVAYAYTSKGLVAATETTVRIVSGAVKTHTDEGLLSSARLGHHHADNIVLLPISGVGTLAYHTETDVWTRLETFYKHALSGFSGSLFLAQDGTTSRELNTANNSGGTAQNVWDSSSAVNIDSIDTSANTLDLDSAVSGWAVGDVIEQGAVVQTIRAIASDVVTVSDASAFSTGAATVYVGYDVEVEYASIGAPSAANAKHLNYSHLWFDGATVEPADPSTFDLDAGPELAVSMTFVSDYDQAGKSTSTVFLDPQNFPWSERFVVPPGPARATVFHAAWNVRACWNTFRLARVSVEFTPVGNKTRTAKN